jgi:hypothetical protein
MAKPEEFRVIYSNFIQITHAPIEFLIDLKRLGPEAQKPDEAPVIVRIVLHPTVAKSFRDALKDNVEKYEEKFGEIPTSQPDTQHDLTLH